MSNKLLSSNTNNSKKNNNELYILIVWNCVFHNVTIPHNILFIFTPYNYFITIFQIVNLIAINNSF